MTKQINPNERILKFLQAPPSVQEAIDQLLDGKPATSEAESTTSGPLLYGMSAAAKFLGVSRATLWRAIKAKRLERVEIMPGSFRVRRADLEAIAAGRKEIK